MATQKQINYVLFLLNKNGYSTRFMNAGFKRLGATMRERSGSVKDWLERMNNQEISNVIKLLKKD